MSDIRRKLRRVEFARGLHSKLCGEAASKLDEYFEHELLLSKDGVKFRSSLDVVKEQAAEIERLRAENEKLRAALKPFALSEHKIERWFGMDIPDSYSVVSQWVTVGDLRAAAAALKETGDE